MPVIFPFLNLIGFNSSLVPLVVIYASLELGDDRAPILAVVLGIMLDLLSRDHLGTAALVLFSLSALIVTQAGRQEAHTWMFRLIFVLVGTFAFFLLNYVLILAETGRWSWPLAVWSKITFGSLLNLLLAAPFFFLAGWPPRLCGWKPAYESQERFYAR
jgi:rod shape-determining protein MreD